MRTITKFVCDKCGKEFESERDAITHESAHYGITPEEWLEWKLLIYRVNDRRLIYKRASSEPNAVFVDMAIEKLREFETEHGLEPYEI